MKTRTSLLAAAIAVVTTLAPAASHAAVWTFTKSGEPWAAHAVTFAQPALDSLIFDVAATGAAPATVTRMTFQISGTVKSPEVGNFQLVYYPGPGRGSGIVVGSGSAPVGISSAVLTIDLTTPVALQGDFAGSFALRLDVNGARAFFFQPQLQSVTIDEGGVIRNVMETGDLPMPGDSFYVN